MPDTRKMSRIINLEGNSLIKYTEGSNIFILKRVSKKFTIEEIFNDKIIPKPTPNRIPREEIIIPYVTKIPATPLDSIPIVRKTAISLFFSDTEIARVDITLKAATKITLNNMIVIKIFSIRIAVNREP